MNLCNERLVQANLKSRKMRSDKKPKSRKKPKPKVKVRPHKTNLPKRTQKKLRNCFFGVLSFDFLPKKGFLLYFLHFREKTIISMITRPSYLSYNPSTHLFSPKTIFPQHLLFPHKIILLSKSAEGLH